MEVDGMVPWKTIFLYQQGLNSTSMLVSQSVRRLRLDQRVRPIRLHRFVASVIGHRSCRSLCTLALLLDTEKDMMHLRRADIFFTCGFSTGFRWT